MKPHSNKKPSSPHSESWECARHLMHAMAEAGVRDVVICPGSRSTSLALAALDTSGMRCHSVIDERSASFFALGITRATDAPTVLICTSGSAPAHFHPAVLEADAAELPLIVVSADRPETLQRSGANQTTDQVKLFGGAVRSFYAVGSRLHGKDAKALQRIGSQAVHDARSPLRGPVHINVRAEKPFEPKAEQQAAFDPEPTVDMPMPLMLPSESAIEKAKKALQNSRRGLIVAGPAPMRSNEGREAILDLVERLGMPFFAESASQYRHGKGYDRGLRIHALPAILESGALTGSLEPDLILQVGKPPVSTPWATFSESCSATRIVLADGRAADPESRATLMLRGNIRRTALSLCERLEPPAHDSTWIKQLVDLEKKAWQAVDEVQVDSNLSEGGVIRSVLQSVPTGGFVMVGNSLPIREIDIWCRPLNASIDVFTQRGLSGIDGLIAGAIGSANALGRPGALILGDISALHDIGSLQLQSTVTSPLAIVVLNNAGGRIFDQLPIASFQSKDASTDYWTTPHETRFEHGACMFGIEYAHVLDVGALDAALSSALKKRSCTLIEVSIDPHEPARSIEALRSRFMGCIP